MEPKSSRDLSGPKSRTDTARERDEAIRKDADKTEGRDRDRIHGDGEDIGLDPGKPPRP